jgi:hypothetical protein
VLIIMRIPLARIRYAATPLPQHGHPTRNNMPHQLSAFSLQLSLKCDSSRAQTVASNAHPRRPHPDAKAEKSDAIGEFRGAFLSRTMSAAIDDFVLLDPVPYDPAAAMGA